MKRAPLFFTVTLVLAGAGAYGSSGSANPNYKTALMSDFLHPNDAGDVVMGDVWYAAIQSYLPAAP